MPKNENANIMKFSTWAAQQSDPRKIENELVKLIDRIAHDAQMTLRDELAKAAIPMSLVGPTAGLDPKLVAFHAYKIADEMLKVRKLDPDELVRNAR